MEFEITTLLSTITAGLTGRRRKKIPDRQAYEPGEGDVILDVPGYCQTDHYSCGAIAGWSVVETLHPKASFHSFYRACRPSPFWGVSVERLTKALQKFNVGVEYRDDLKFTPIADAIEAGFPILTNIGHGLAAGEHWVVIKGVNRSTRHLFICGLIRPGDSEERYSWKKWREMWNPVGEGLICYGWSRSLRQ